MKRNAVGNGVCTYAKKKIMVRGAFVAIIDGGIDGMWTGKRSAAEQYHGI